MSRRSLTPEMVILEQQIIATLRAGYEKPESFSDWQGCARALLRMFIVQRRPLSVDLEYEGGEPLPAKETR